MNYEGKRLIVFEFFSFKILHLLEDDLFPNYVNKISRTSCSKQYVQIENS